MSNLYYGDTEEKNSKSFFLPGSKPHYNPDSPGQVNHIFLDLVLDIASSHLEGTCNIKLTPVKTGITTLTLDAVDLEIESVLVNQVSQPFEYDRHSIKISLLQPTTKETLLVSIKYHLSNPQRGIYFIKPTLDYPNKPTQVWTQGEDEDSRYWFPCFDYPGQLASSEVRVVVPKPLIAISNGDLIASEDLGENTSYRWLQTAIHPTYLMTLAVGDFAELKDTWRDNIPITYYVEKGKEEAALLSMGKTPKMVEFYSQKFGYDYPYSKYAQVCVDDFIFGGMENTSTTLLTDRCLLDKRASLDNLRTETLVAHELAHQWFGDLVVIKHWSHAWIKEGMATYSEVLWIDAEYGHEEAAYYRLGQLRNYLEEDASRYRRPIVTNIYREAIELYDRHLYEKGACVYHMIRTILGDELYDLTIANFIKTYANKTVETIDLLRVIESTTGNNLQPLFDQYVFRGGHPDYEVSYLWDNENNLAKLTVKQTQDELFELKMPLGFGYLGIKVDLQIFTLSFKEKEQTFYLPLAKKPDFISFDVGNHYLKTVSLKYPLEELKAQLKHDPDPISRINAAIALREMGGLKAVEVLNDSLINEPFWAVRVEVAGELSKIALNSVEDILLAKLNDPHPRVRRAIIGGLSQFKTEKTYTQLKEYLIKGDASYYTESAIAQNLGKIATATLKEKQAEVIEVLKEVLETKAGWNEVVRSGAISGLSQLSTNPQAVEAILSYTKLPTPQSLRLTAIRALGRVSQEQKETEINLIYEQLETISKETFFLTEIAVTSALGQMKTPRAIAILQSLAERTHDGRISRLVEEAIGRVQASLGSTQGLESLRQDFDKLKEENNQIY